MLPVGLNFLFMLKYFQKTKSSTRYKQCIMNDFLTMSILAKLFLQKNPLYYVSPSTKGGNIFRPETKGSTYSSTLPYIYHKGRVRMVLMFYLT